MIIHMFRRVCAVVTIAAGLMLGPKVLRLQQPIM